MPDADVIIPAFNEERTVGGVVRTALRSPLIGSVIVVDDGSRDRTSTRAAEAGARVIRHARRRGKGAALRTGVRASSAPFFLFLDADLFRLTPTHIARILAPVLAGKLSMHVGLRDHGPFDWLVTHLPIVSGQRALRREVFEAVPASFIRGYDAEIVLNAACRYRKFSHGFVGLSGLSVRRKFDKIGIGRAVFQYARMWFQVLSAMRQVRVAHKRGEF